MTKKLVTISLFIFWAVVVAILTAGLVFYDNNKQNASSANSIDNLGLKPGEKITLNLTEIAKHNYTNDCWLIINNKVYNVTSYLSQHPGGTSAVAPYCGGEATRAFQTKDQGTPHSNQANNLVAVFLIGDLNEGVTTQTLVNTNQNIQNNLINNQRFSDDEAEDDQDNEDD